MATYILQRLAKSTGTSTAPRFEDVEQFEAPDAEEALSLVISKRQLWVGDDPWYPEVGGRRIPMTNDANEQWYLFERA
ncbi:MAG: hypothetical protein L0Y71_13320 [Gemmataceae bacterium]|nr:hypothetical protein [Gemmataceae bacterium]